MSDEREMGFLTYEGANYPFAYEQGVLRLFPRNEEEQLKWQEKVIEQLIARPSQEEALQWIPVVDLYGKTSAQKNIMFRVSNEGNECGFLSFQVIIYVVYNASVSLDCE